MQTSFIYDRTPHFMHSYVLAASRYTGKERDTESGNDYFGARYYASTMGRFMSPDWSAKQEPVPYSKLDNPQSLNLYSYVLNNPLSNVDTDGHACESLYFNTGSGFCTRATEYGQIDARSGIQSQTRFFAAANAVSQALADVATPISGMFVSSKTSSFLEGVGQNLQKLNESEANAIQNGSLSGPNLDQQLVHNEQSSVQGQLNSFQQSDPTGYTKAIGEINGSLNGMVTKGLEQLTGTDRAYAGVLAGVRTSLGRDIDFSKQGDREAIGNALIQHVRQTGGCDLNGSKQGGCK
ncbi:MAG: RHS repeat-associated core domain-containing protein [Silvibacterium sp.]